MNSIRIKLMLISTVVVIVMSISGALMLLDVRNRELSTAEEELAQRSNYVAESIVRTHSPGEWVDEFARLNTAPGGVRGIESVVLSATGMPIAPLEFGAFAFTDRAVISAIGGTEYFAAGIRAPDLNGVASEWLVLATPVEHDGVRYILYSRTSAVPMQENLSQLTFSIALMMLVALVLVLFLWWLFAGTWSAPIMALTRHAREMAKGHLDTEIPVKGNDEIGELTQSFNHMARELNTMLTEFAKLDTMRREFVANVSHELRTPLASVCSYTETLLAGACEDPETARRFLGVIDEESRRMTLLVQDLLTLSRMDEALQLETEPLDLCALTQTAVRQTTLIAKQKGQRIQFVPPQDPCFIEADPVRINQVMTNILSNAVKYSREATTITVTLESNAAGHTLRIADEGMGIALADLSRIFERFYRVDKARSRDMGGTGLGLAIAKEIMDAHGFSLAATSQVGQGTTMEMQFKAVTL